MKIDTSNILLALTVKMRWGIERDYLELKQEVELGHYEGRNWRGIHHHASLCIAVYGFPMLERLSGVKKTPLNLKRLPYPKPSACAALSPMQRHVPWAHPNRSLSAGTRHRYAHAAESLIDGNLKISNTAQLDR